MFSISSAADLLNVGKGKSHIMYYYKSLTESWSGEIAFTVDTNFRVLNWNRTSVNPNLDFNLFWDTMFISSTFKNIAGKEADNSHFWRNFLFFLFVISDSG